MGFESSEVARRRLAVLAASNDRVQEALAPSTFPGMGLGGGDREVRPTYHREGVPATSVAASPVPTSPALVQQLDDLAQDIVATPGAGGALLAAYAAQARALSMVVEAAKRAGAAPLPTAVLLAAQEALMTPSPMMGFAM
ncbi:MAG: hypothetical protein K2R93_06660 [Gemmatimonadaceae bacterium]|nr:hypothetical protein [Gemmatimonadaceae bacterium]